MAITNSQCTLELVDSDGNPTNLIKFRDINYFIYKPVVGGQTFLDVLTNQAYNDFVNYVQAEEDSFNNSPYYGDDEYILTLKNLAFSLGSGMTNDDWANMDFHPENPNQAQGILSDGTFHVKENGGQYGNPNALPYYYRQDYGEHPNPASEFSFQNSPYKDNIPIPPSMVSIYEGSVEDGIESVLISFRLEDIYDYVFGITGGQEETVDGMHFNGNADNNDAEDLYQSNSNANLTVVPSLNQGWGDLPVSTSNEEQDPFYDYNEDPIPAGLDILFGFQCQFISHISTQGNIITIDSSKATLGRYRGTNDEDAIVKQFQLNVSDISGEFTAPYVHLDYSSVYAWTTDTVNQGEVIALGTQFAINDFSGAVSVFVVDKDDNQVNIDGFFAQFNVTYNDVDDRANYGTIDFEDSYDASLQGWGVTFNVNPNISYNINFTYTGSVEDSGVDQFSVYLHLGSLVNDTEPEWGEWWEENVPNSERLWDLGSIVINVNEVDFPTSGCTDPTATNYDSDATIDDGSCVYNGDNGDNGDFVVATGEDYDPDEARTMVVNPSDIMFHLMEQELGYNKKVNVDKIIEARNNQAGWKLAFSINKEIDSKKLLKEIALSSKCLPTFSNNEFSFAYIQNTYTGDEEIFTIKQEDVIKYNVSRTPLDEIYTEVEVKYHYDYGLEKYLESTGKLKINEDYYENAYGVTMNYGDFDGYNPFDITQKNNYYGLKFDKATNTLDHIDTSHLFENEYIRKQDTGTAIELAEHILLWHCNQHNIIELNLPLKYYNLEVGDLVEFNEMILGKKIYNEKYVIKEQSDMPIRCGQYILPLFMVTDVTKTTKGVKLKIIQLHHLSKSTLVWKDIQYRITENPALVGDITGDGDVNVIDIVQLVSYVMTEEPYNETYDLNGDGSVNILDIIVLVDIVVGG